MPEVRSLWRTTVGKVTAICFFLTAAYIFWLLGFNKNPEVERWISSIGINFSQILFIYFGIHMLKEYPMNSRLRNSWILLIAATASLAIGEFIYVLAGKPPLSAADVFYVFYYILFAVGILRFPFMPVSRREKSLLTLDLSIVLTAALVLLWYFLIDSVVAWIPVKSNDVLANLAYPFLDFSICACAIIIIQRDVEGLHPLTLLWIAVAKGFAALADACLIYGWVQNQPVFLDWSSASFAMERFLVLLAIAYQIMFLRYPGEFRAFSIAKRIVRDALPYIATFVILVLLTVGLISQKTLTLNLRGALFGTLALIIMVLYRQYIMLKENLFLYHEAKDAREEAEKATKAKAEFLANMSHEIRTPMHGVIGTTQVLLNTNLSDQQKNIVETIRSSGNTLLDVINDILDFSKIESGRMELQSQPFDLRSCIQEAFDPIRLEASKKGIQLLSSIASGVPPMIVGDAARLREIILNLLGNAVKFTNEGEVVLLARCKNNQGTSYEFEISVRDSGIGIPEQMQNTLFQPFSQIDTSYSRFHSGTGLGLAISKRLCEMMGGRMWLESSVDHGSTFYFTFIATAKDVIDSQDAVSDFRIDSKLSERLPLKILVAEDNLVHQKIALLMLEQMGYK
ncbi:ATP-binding protein, partial [bacterium]|nr:ATP-binding protein [bacterium]